MTDDERYEIITNWIELKKRIAAAGKDNMGEVKEFWRTTLPLSDGPFPSPPGDGWRPFTACALAILWERDAPAPAERDAGPGLVRPEEESDTDLVLGLEDALTTLNVSQASTPYLIDRLVHDEIRHAGDPSLSIRFQRLRKAISAYAPQARGEIPATQILTKLLRQHENRPVNDGARRLQIKSWLGGNALAWSVEEIPNRPDPTASEEPTP